MEHSPKAATGGAGGGSHGFPWRAVGAILVALSLLVGIAMILASTTIAAPDSQLLQPPAPDPAVAPPVQDRYTAPERAGTTTNPGAPTPAGMPRSRPTRIRIPSIGVDAKLMALGVRKNGTVEVPPLEDADQAGWYKRGPSPGEIGNAVVVGHVDSYAIGPAVFFNLGLLQPGDTITITRKDGRDVTFVVDGVASYPKQEFPTERVYGPSYGEAGLRLVTCGGTFDDKAGEYPDNVIVFATLKT